jgi:integrase
MARQSEQLTSLQVQRAEAGWHYDGLGLYLRVDKSGNQYWYFRWGKAGKKYLALGPAHTLDLKDARERARACRQSLLDHRDPRTERSALRAIAKLEVAKTITFSQAADRYFQNHKVAWRSEKHASDWCASLRAHVEPVLGALPVAAIDTDLVLKVLEKIWSTRTITAGRVRQRVEAVLDFARTRGWRDGENPARWKGHLANLLPAPRKVAPVKHYAALAYNDVPAFVRKLRDIPGTAARCLEFTILTTARAGESCGARHTEIDGNVWTIPPERMKSGRAHRVPLSRAALAVLPQKRDGSFVFPRGDVDRPLATDALWRIATELGECTVHGFRSAFRDWASEQTNFSGEAAELALAHTIPNATEAAYRRGDQLEIRRRLMERWARYCAGEPSGVVVPMTRGRRHGG